MGVGLTRLEVDGSRHKTMVRDDSWCVGRGLLISGTVGYRRAICLATSCAISRMHNENCHCWPIADLLNIIRLPNYWVCAHIRLKDVKSLSSLRTETVGLA